MPMMMCNLGAEAVESDDDADASLTWKWIWPIYGRYKVMFLFRRNPAVPSHHPPPATANKIRPVKVPIHSEEHWQSWLPRNYRFYFRTPHLILCLQFSSMLTIAGSIINYILLQSVSLINANLYIYLVQETHCDLVDQEIFEFLSRSHSFSLSVNTLRSFVEALLSLPRPPLI